MKVVDKFHNWRVSQDNDMRLQGHDVYVKAMPTLKFKRRMNKPNMKLKMDGLQKICKNRVVNLRIVLMLGECAGYEDSFCCKYMLKLGYKSLFVYPNNKH